MATVEFELDFLRRKILSEKSLAKSASPVLLQSLMFNKYNIPPLKLFTLSISMKLQLNRPPALSLHLQTLKLLI